MCEKVLEIVLPLYVFYSYTNRVELDEEVVEEMNRGMCFISQGLQSYFSCDYVF